MFRTCAAALLAVVLLAADPPPPYRITFLTRTGGYLIVSGGDALRVSDRCTCANLAPGTSAIVRLDDTNKVVELRRSDGTETVADKLPPGAIVVDPRSARTLADTQGSATDVTVTLVVTVPADTPPGDDLYVSTARSGWNAAELRMSRVDPLHWSVSLRLPANQQLLYRYSRGSFQTLEADRSGQPVPARKIVAKEGLTERDAILRFSDSS